MVLPTHAQRTASLALLALCLLTATVAVAVDAAHHLRHRKKLVESNAHRVMALKARGPQPRIVNVGSDLQVASSEMLEPVQTVLHRCDEVACCAFTRRRRCVPTEDSVKLYFRATDIATRKKRVIEHQFRNHTACQCL